MKYRVVYIILLTFLIIGLTGCRKKEFLNGEYVSLDVAYVSYKCNKDECNFDMSSVYAGGEFVKQTYVYKLEEKETNVFRVYFTNKENGQEHTAIWNKDEDSLYVEDLKVKCQKAIDVGIESKTDSFNLKLTKVFSDKILSYNTDSFDYNFLLSSYNPQNNVITALENYKFVGFEFEISFKDDSDKTIDIYNLFELYTTEFEKYNANEIWAIGQKPIFQEYDNVTFTSAVKDVTFVYRGYYTIPKDESTVYLKVGDNSNSIYTINLNNK